jgi:hypothetical protein
MPAEQRTLKARTRDERLRERLGRAQFIEDLERILAEMTPSEDAFLAGVDLDAPITDEERAAWGPGFVDDVVEETLRRIAAPGQGWPMGFAEGVDLLGRAGRPNPWNSGEPDQVGGTTESRETLTQGLFLLELLSEMEGRDALLGIRRRRIHSCAAQLAKDLTVLWRRRAEHLA